MAHHLSWPRNPIHWGLVRRAVAHTMLENVSSPLWQEAFLACDELDVAQGMPVVSEPIPVDDALLGFPSATIASLRSEGLREEPLPSIKVLPKATGSASSSGLKAGGTHSKAKLPGPSF